jgi:hypothetical protein
MMLDGSPSLPDWISRSPFSGARCRRRGTWFCGRIVRRQGVRGFCQLPICLVGIEACASPHYWARELITQGHEVKLMPAQYVKPYVKRGKNGAVDVEAICEAVTRPTMRFVGVKTVEHQSITMLHRVRLILMRQRTQLSNALRSHLAEFRIVSAIGRVSLDRLLTIVTARMMGACPASTSGIERATTAPARRNRGGQRTFRKPSLSKSLVRHPLRLVYLRRGHFGSYRIAKVDRELAGCVILGASDRQIRPYESLPIVLRHAITFRIQ